MAYQSKQQHTAVSNISQTANPTLSVSSIKHFSLTIGGTVNETVAVDQNFSSIGICNTDTTNSVKFSLKAQSTTSGSDIVLFKEIVIPAATTLLLESEEIKLVSKPLEGFRYYFSIVSGSGGTPTVNFVLRT